LHEETKMLNRTLLCALAVLLAAFLTPSTVHGWGAARVGYARVGPYGGVHGGSRTVVAGPGGVAVGGRSFGVGPYGGYRAGGAAVGGYGGYRVGGYGYGGYGGYRYGGAAVGGYGWVR
jgi:hypothetical protein